MWLQNPFTLATLDGALVLVLYCLSAVARAYAQRRRYLRALASVQSGAQAPITAYQAYLRSTPNKVPAWALMVDGIGQVLLGSAIGVIAIDGVISGGVAGSIRTEIGVPAFQAILLVLSLVALAQALSAILLVALIAVWATAPANAHLRGLPTRAGELVRLQVKNALVYSVTPVVVSFVSLSVAFFGAPIWAAVAVWGIGQISVNLILALGHSVILRWLYSCEPIELTEWAELGKRIQAWAQLAGTPLRAIYLRYMASYATVDWSIVGLGKQTLFVNDVFLAATDWRQRDAYTGLLLEVGRNARKASRRWLILNCVSRAILVFGYGYLIYAITMWLFPIVMSLFDASTSSANTGSWATNLVIFILLPLSLLLGVGQVLHALGRQLNRSGSTAHLDADRASMDLVGDPLALLAALYLIWDYPCGGLQRRLVNNTDSQQRVVAVQQRLSVPGPFAPWFSYPIPSPIPIMVGPYLLSVPPTPEMISASAPPVPTTRYPISAPLPFAPVPYAPAPIAPMPVSSMPAAPMPRPVPALPGESCIPVAISAPSTPPPA